MQASTTVVKVTKQAQAITIVQGLMAEMEIPTYPSRKVLMARFMNELGMSKPGASTYVANLKKLFNGDSQPIVVKSKKAVDIQVEPEVPALPVFSKCFCVGDEIVDIAVATNVTAARKLTAKPETIQQYAKLSEVLIEGVPDDICSRKELKEKFTFIRIR